MVGWLISSPTETNPYLCTCAKQQFIQLLTATYSD